MRSMTPLACALWLLSLLLAAPHAQEEKKAAGSKVLNPHQALALFTHSDNCVSCHNNLTTPNGVDVSIGSTWRSTHQRISCRLL